MTNYDKSNEDFIIAIDFDGTITDNDGTKIINMRQFAPYYINKLYNEGYQIVIWTARAGKLLEDAKSWLDKFGVQYHKINENIIDDENFYPKIYAHLYIDDKALWESDSIPEWSELYERTQKYFKRWRNK